MSFFRISFRLLAGISIKDVNLEGTGQIGIERTRQIQLTKIAFN